MIFIKPFNVLTDLCRLCNLKTKYSQGYLDYVVGSMPSNCLACIQRVISYFCSNMMIVVCGDKHFSYANPSLLSNADIIIHLLYFPFVV